MGDRPVRSVMVVVPAHDEEDTIVACLDSLGEACSRLRVPNRVIVVADACRDATAAQARHWGATVLDVNNRNVGAARRTGMGHAVAAVADVGCSGLWLATTDADSCVPGDWLAHQLDRADGGVDALLGTVELGTGALEADSRQRFDRRYLAWKSRSDRHHHVHGANLAVRASAYITAGGFPPITAHEDVALVNRLDRLTNTVVARSTDCPVVTSPRTVGRTPHGLAADLRTLTGTTDHNK